MGFPGPLRAADCDARVRVAHTAPQDSAAKCVHGQHVPGLPAGPWAELQHQAGEQAGRVDPRHEGLKTEEGLKTNDEGSDILRRSSLVLLLMLEPQLFTRVSIAGAVLHSEVAR